MLYQRKHMSVSAVKLQHGATIGLKVGQPGDYLVTFEDGSIGIMTAEVFEGNFEPLPAVPVQYFKTEPVVLPSLATPPAPGDPKPTGYICVGCGSDTVPDSLFDKKTGMCASCLKQDIICQSCGSPIKQYEQVGTYCRKCLVNPA